MAQSKSREKLIARAESFCKGASRSRLELRLVDEIRKLEREVEELRAKYEPDA